MARLVLLDELAQALVAPQIGFHRGLDRLLRQRSHGQELVLQFGELLMKVNTRHYGVSSISPLCIKQDYRRTNFRARTRTVTFESTVYAPAVWGGGSSILPSKKM